MIARLSLVVIRSDDIEKSRAFYSALGLDFEQHDHPPCGKHYASEQDGFVFEICRRNLKEPTTSVFLGLHVGDLEERLKAIDPTSIVRPAEEGDWGRSAIVVDPDGHRIMLTER